MVRLDPSRKHGEDFFKGPYTVSQVNENGTVKLTRVTNKGAVSQTWNIRQIEPCKDRSPMPEPLSAPCATRAHFNLYRVLLEPK